MGVTKSIILDETGKAIVTALNQIASQTKDATDLAASAQESAASAAAHSASVDLEVSALQTAIAALPDGQAVSETVAEHTVELSEIGLEVTSLSNNKADKTTVSALSTKVDNNKTTTEAEISTFEQTITNQINNYRPIEITGNVTNAADEEDITSDSNSLLKFKNRNNLNGMGYIIMRRESTFASQLTQENTIYEIRYDFDLGGASVTIPSGCVLKFNGGKLGNGTLVGNHTVIQANAVVIWSGSISFSGTWNVTEAIPEWWGAVANQTTDCTTAIQSAINFCYKNNGGTCKLGVGDYLISSSIITKPYVNIVGCSSQARYHGSRFVCNFSEPKSWVIDTDYINEGEFAEYNDIMFKDYKESATYIKTWSLLLSDFSIVNKSSSLLYGGIRLFNTLYTTLERIFIQGTAFGIASTYTWQLSIKDCYCRVYTNAIAFGPLTTVATIQNFYGGQTKLDYEFGTTYNVTGLSAPDFGNDYFGVDVNAHIYPAWVNLADDTAKMEFFTCFYLNQAFVSFYNTTCDQGNFLVSSHYSYATFNDNHIENLTDGIAWCFGGTGLSAAYGYAFRNVVGGYFNNIFNTYAYGAINAKIVCDDFFVGRCYHDSTINDRYYTNYVFENNGHRQNAAYYDDYEIDSDTGLPKNQSKLSKKTIIYDNNRICVGHTTDDIKMILGAGLDNISPAQDDIVFSDMDRVKNAIIDCNSTTQFNGGIEYKDIDVRFGCNYYGSNVKINASFKLNNSNIYFDYFNEGRCIIPNIGTEYTGSLIHTKGKCKIDFGTSDLFTRYMINRYNSNTFFSNLITIDDDSEIEVYGEDTTDAERMVNYIARGDFKFENPNNKRYTINIYFKKSGTLCMTYSNVRGTTSNRPTLTSAEKGFEYFDTDICMPIFWNGTAWTNAIGTAV